jgi:hypothetical protein
MELAAWTLTFARHLLLVAILLAVGAILFAGLGRGLGIPLLFWHERPSKQTLAGLAVSLLVSEVLFVAALLDVGASVGGVDTMPVAMRAVGAYVTRGWTVVLLVMAAGLLVAAAVKRGLPAARLTPMMEVAGAPARADEVGPKRIPRWPLFLGLGLGLLVSYGVGNGAAFVVRTILDPAGGGSFRALARLLVVPAGTPGAAEPLHFLAALIFSLLSLYFVANAFLTRGIGATPAVAICTMLALVAAAAGFLVFRRINPLAVTGALLAFLLMAGLPRHKLRFPCFSDQRYRNPTPTPTRYVPPAPRALLDPRTTWEARAGRGPMVLVCASGGGIRAAVWTVAVLCELEETLADFAARIQMIAGASGGMLGAGHYVTSLRAATAIPAATGAGLHVLPTERLIATMAQDGLSELAKAMVFRDLPLAFLPFRNRWDRGLTIEATWRRQLGPSFEATFADLRPAEAAGRIPSLVYSPMLVEDGRRILISNLDLEPITVNVGMGLRGPEETSRSAYQLAGLLPDAGALPVSTAARMSASFPYVMPSPTLPLAARRRLVDAGYYDNYGVNLVSGWLYDELQRDGGAWLQEHVPSILVVQIRDEPLSLSASDGALATTARSPLGRSVEGLSTPAEALLAARDSVMLFRNDEQLEALALLADQRIKPNFLRHVTFSFRGEASLSWYLTANETASLRGEAQRLLASPEGQALISWWNDRQLQAGRAAS